MSRTMKKQLSHFTIMMLVAAVALTSCGQRQAENEKESPLKVTYTIDCSRDLLSLCDLVVTYKGNDGDNVVDTITSAPGDSAVIQTWNIAITTHKIPVTIGFDYRLVPKTDTLILDQPTASLQARCTIIAEKMGIRNEIPMPSEKVINGKYIFFKNHDMMDEEVSNTRHNLANFIKNHNDSLAASRETDDSNTCFTITKHPYGSGLHVKPACWNDGATK